MKILVIIYWMSFSKHFVLLFLLRLGSFLVVVAPIFLLQEIRFLLRRGGSKSEEEEHTIMAARNTNTIPPHPNHNCSGGDADKSDGVRKTNEKTTSTDFISSLKAVILVGGAQKGTRFRPLSLQLPKPLFPIAGNPLIEHHISQLCELPGLSEILLLGFYSAEEFADFIAECTQKYAIPVRYLQECESLGTAGGLLRFRAELLTKHPSAIFVINADVCGDLPLLEMTEELERQESAECLILTTEATRDQSTNYGCVVVDSKDSEHPKGKVLHYVDKPTTFLSTHISCGVYIFRPMILSLLEKLSQSDSLNSQVWFETEIFPQMAANETLYALHTSRWWSQTKTAAAALYANRHYLRLYRERCPERLCGLTKSEPREIIGDVFIDPSADVHPTAKIGPNVSIGPNAKIGAGVRIRESIILADCVLEDHSCVLHSVIGWRSVLGAWSRVEGTPIAPNPNVPFAKLDNKPMFNSDGRLNPSLTILGSDVHVFKELVILNSVVLPYKDLSSSYKNQIIL